MKMARMDINRFSWRVLAYRKLLMLLFSILFWLTGAIILAVGVWTKMNLYKYLKLSSFYQPEMPFLLIGLGAFIVLIGCLGCCCAIKGSASIIYMVCAEVTRVQFWQRITCYRNIFGQSWKCFLFIIFIIEFVSGVVLLINRGQIEEDFKDDLTNALYKYGKKDQEQITLVLDELQKKGCYKQVLDVIDLNLASIGWLAISLSFFQIIGVFLAIWLVKSMDSPTYLKIV